MGSALSWRGYASSTQKTAGESREDIQESLARYGADGFAYAQDDEHAMAWIAFRVDGVRVRLTVQLPQRGQCRSDTAHEQKIRTRWRMFHLLSKARLEAVTNGVQTFEEAFLPDVVTESGATVAEVLRPALAAARAAGTLPVLSVGSLAPALALPAAPTRKSTAVDAEIVSEDEDAREDDEDEDDEDDEDDENDENDEDGDEGANHEDEDDEDEDDDEDEPQSPPKRPRGRPRLPYRERDSIVPTHQVIPVDRLTRRSDRFACGPLGWEMTVQDCLARREQAATAMRRQGKGGICYGCGQGAAVAERIRSQPRAA
jgi:hypothetical protein